MVVRQNEPLGEHCTLRIGGRARLYAEPETVAELADLLGREKNCLLLGNGSNVLFGDGLLDLTLISTLRLEEIRAEGETLHAACGARLSAVALAAQRAGLAGLAFAHGIPGTLGGGVLMNAGAYNGELKDVVESVTVLRAGEVLTLPAADCGFAYRHSVFGENGDVILGATLRLTPGDPAAILAEMRQLMERRRASQPLDLPSAGSTFKRPPGDYAARLIDAAGLRGLRRGDAQVSEKHTGFLVNRGRASFADFFGLMQEVQERVFAYSGIRLEPEVRIIQ